MVVESAKRAEAGIRAASAQAQLGPSGEPAKAGRAALSGSRRGLNLAVHGLRGVAALMVLCAHILGGTAAHIYPNDSAYGLGIQPFWNVGTYGVPIFFMISGFVILPSVLKYSPGEFAIRRFVRIYPLFFATTVAFALMNWATNAYPDKNNLPSVVYSLLFLDLFTPTQQVAPNAWSLSYEVMFYVVACLTNWVMLRRRLGVLRFVYLLLPLYLLYLFPRAIFFIFGGLIYWINRKHLFTASFKTIPFEIMAFVACFYFASQGHFNYHRYELLNPVVIMVILSTAAYFSLAVGSGSLTARLLGNPFSLYLGTISYSLYLVHPYTYLVCRDLFDKLHLFTANITGSMALFFGVTIAASIVASHFVHMALERWPYEWFFRQRIYQEHKGNVPAAPADIGPSSDER